MSGPHDAASLRAAILAIVKRVPVSDLPAEGTLSLVDNGTAEWTGDRRVQAKFIGGQWVRPNGQPLPFEPTHWFRFGK